MNEGTKWIRVGTTGMKTFFQKNETCQQIKTTCNVLFHSKKSRKLKM